MNSTRTPVDSFDFALEALAHLALARIALVAGKQDDAEQHLRDAESFARESGSLAYREKRAMPMSLSDAPFLIRDWNGGYDAAKSDNVVWFGEWLSALDGLYETRPSVSYTQDGFVPTLGVFLRGGSSYGHPRETLQEAIGAAKEMESQWHFEE